MKFQTYTSTLGLNHFPAHDRFKVYRATHKILLGEDAEYRRRYQSYIAKIVILCFLIPGVFLKIATFGLWPTISFQCAIGISILFVAFRQQEYQNKRIGEQLAIQKCQQVGPPNDPQRGSFKGGQA